MKDPGHFVSVKKENHEEASKDAISRRNSHTHSKTKKYISKFITMHIIYYFPHSICLHKALNIADLSICRTREPCNGLAPHCTGSRYRAL